jgi:hypothetical protein
MRDLFMAPSINVLHFLQLYKDVQFMARNAMHYTTTSLRDFGKCNVIYFYLFIYCKFTIYSIVYNKSNK